MPVYVRAKDPVNGAEFTTSAEFAESAGLDVLKDKDAVDGDGRPLPVKFRITKSTTTKEN